ncbi:hypothetical protein S40293_03175 [Stachybotrys chartarum IBT 40293]|nr:hypothetical protein S40293_03175 [Stachybotrys chartarum IBT 40293]
MSGDTAHGIYPRYCFHLAPTFNRWCWLRVSEIHGLRQPGGYEGEKFYFFDTLPIKWVRVVGVIVAVDEFAGRRVFTLDDSSGACIEACLLLPNPTITVEANPIGQVIGIPTVAATAINQAPDVGTVVNVKGELTTFRNERQITVKKINSVRSTSHELALWEQRAAFQRDILEKPWILSSQDVRRCRKEAEQSEAEAKKKRKRLKAMTDIAANRTSFQAKPEPLGQPETRNSNVDAERNSTNESIIPRVKITKDNSARRRNPLAPSQLQGESPGEGSAEEPSDSEASRKKTRLQAAIGGAAGRNSFGAKPWSRTDCSGKSASGLAEDAPERRGKVQLQAVVEGAGTRASFQPVPAQLLAKVTCPQETSASHDEIDKRAARLKAAIGGASQTSSFYRG